jgi:adenine-specific DNA-methyltransferase
MTEKGSGASLSQLAPNRTRSERLRREQIEGVGHNNLALDELFNKDSYSSKDSECDLIYVNGGNNLENPKAPDDTWKVRLIEEDFFRLMFETERV